MSKKHFDFSDVNLIPKKGIVKSRSSCDTSIEWGKYKFAIPIYPANMASVMTEEMAYTLASNGYFYTMHRFLTDDEHIKFIKKMKDHRLFVSISIGVGVDWKMFMFSLTQEDLIPDFVTIDIAHGHTEQMLEMVKYVKDIMPSAIIIGGNICTVEAARDLVEWGCDAVKVGIAPGKVCTTAMATRFGSRGIQASIIRKIAKKVPNVKIIADGGIREHGDIAVALTMGADMVMAGSMFAGFPESGGDIVERPSTRNNRYSNVLYPNDKFREYYGSASSSQAGKTNRIEGTKITVPYKDRSVLTEMVNIKESLQSAISYAGGNDLSAFLNVKYIITK